MPAINFQKRFVEPIIAGTKTSTIRKIRKDGKMHCQPGDTLKLYTGQRTKSCKLIAEVRCLSYTPITICISTNFTGSEIVINDRLIDLHPQERLKTALSEGFSGLGDMRAWFVEYHQIDKREFNGWQIQWEAITKC